MSTENVLDLADRADRMVTALNKIMAAALKITNERDWCLIGGQPYLQETGASKVARLFGISWRIHPGYPKAERDTNGYPLYTYRMTFSLCGASIEADGSRNAKDEFFAGKKEDKNGKKLEQKNVDEIDLGDVKRSAYTNCLNNGIKRILPGLRNIGTSDLEAAGLDVSKVRGYVFKDGSKGGNTGKAEDSGLTCEKCGAAITQKVASFSEAKFGHRLCMDCQKKAAAAQNQPQA
ncbi:MAG: hypothetical protein IKU30_05790 [Clostridia bacterium]|nr:hypothetical protein [Clostridia bacterium]